MQPGPPLGRGLVARTRSHLFAQPEVPSDGGSKNDAEDPEADEDDDFLLRIRSAWTEGKGELFSVSSEMCFRHENL